ncbi:MAG: SOS response-associated peptidase [Pedobacter sp.]
MCYHKSNKAEAKQLKAALNVPYPREDEHKIYYHANGFAHPDFPVLSNDNGKSINLYNWGLIPSWTKSWADAAKLRNQTLNAKSETIFEKPAFRGSIMKNRCIIPVTGFFEWKHVEKNKIPYYIHPKEHPFFLLAGIYSKWMVPETNEWMTTYSVITTDANTLMADIHNSAKRMPLMIDYRNIDTWLDTSLPKEGVIELMSPCDDRDMAAHIVSNILSSPKVDSNIPEITDEIPPITLF